jgi:phosphatidylinositol-bisphosphatase
MVGLLNIVLVRQSLLAHISGIEHDNVKLGFMNKYGNKGAVIIRFQLDKTRLCFVNCHLPSSIGSTESRLKAF